MNDDSGVEQFLGRTDTWTESERMKRNRLSRDGWKGLSRFSKSKENAQSRKKHAIWARSFKQFVLLKSRAESWEGWKMLMVVTSAFLRSMNFILEILGSLGKIGVIILSGLSSVKNTYLYKHIYYSILCNSERLKTTYLLARNNKLHRGAFRLLNVRQPLKEQSTFLRNKMEGHQAILLNEKKKKRWKYNLYGMIHLCKKTITPPDPLSMLLIFVSLCVTSFILLSSDWLHQLLHWSRWDAWPPNLPIFVSYISSHREKSIRHFEPKSKTIGKNCQYELISYGLSDRPRKKMAAPEGWGWWVGVGGLYLWSWRKSSF